MLSHIADHLIGRVIYSHQDVFNEKHGKTAVLEKNMVLEKEALILYLKQNLYKDSAPLIH